MFFVGYELSCAATERRKNFIKYFSKSFDLVGEKGKTMYDIYIFFICLDMDMDIGFGFIIEFSKEELLKIIFPHLNEVKFQKIFLICDNNNTDDVIIRKFFACS